ncbi:hypothetical protein K438DRAFT_1764704 [Mycena galopus ATCC 62051]|nr:hypothetical protein K438DRAFT_1764704 [Mycena galopus ATCC 62051]
MQTPFIASSSIKLELWVHFSHRETLGNPERAAWLHLPFGLVLDFKVMAFEPNQGWKITSPRFSTAAPASPSLPHLRRHRGSVKLLWRCNIKLADAQPPLVCRSPLFSESAALTAPQSGRAVTLLLYYYDQIDRGIILQLTRIAGDSSETEEAASDVVEHKIENKLHSVPVSPTSRSFNSSQSSRIEIPFAGTVFYPVASLSASVYPRWP